MFFRLAPLVVAVLVLAPFPAEAQQTAAETPSTQGPFGYNDLTRASQDVEIADYQQRLAADWQLHHTDADARNAPDIYTVKGEQEAVAEYLKRHPNDRQELWRFNYRDVVTPTR